MFIRKVRDHRHFGLFFQLVRYGAVGGISTLIHILVAIAFIRFINDSIIWSNLLGFGVAFIFSYIVQSFLVFRSKLSVPRALKFLTVQLIALSAALLVSISIVAAHPYLKIVMTAMLLPLMAFVVHKLWTFSAAEK
ncbi:GtrA family protein [Aurantivibrio infirmus]